MTQLWRGIGGGLRYDEERACFVPDGGGTAVARDRGRRGGRGAHVACRSGSRRPRTCPGTSSTCSATRRSPTCSEAVGHDLHSDRTREARHLHRHRDRPGPHQRRAHRRDREPGVGRRPRRAGADERPAARTRRSPTPCWPGATAAPAARPDPHHPDPRLARRARRGVRERRPVEASLVLPGRPASRWTRRWLRECARRAERRSASWTPRRLARSRSSDPMPRPSSTACTRTGCRPWRWARSATA